MEIVAYHLQKEAINRRSNPVECNLFGRAAYNRYYYAMFLIVREKLVDLNPDWSGTGHSSYPEILNGTVKKRIASGRKSAVKIGDGPLIALCQKALHAAHQLSELMRLGYAVRVVADYNPQVSVNFISADRFKLNDVEITAAHEWPDRAKIYADTIASAWSQINA